MAPHSLHDTGDSSDYTPRYVEYSRAPKSQHASTIDSKNTDAGRDAGAFVQRLDERDVRMVEESLRCFEDRELPLSSLSPATFPLDAKLREKLRILTDDLFGQQKFKVLAGIEPSRYTARQNVVIHAGISSHVGSKRGMPGRAGGDRTVLNHITAMKATGKPEGTYHGPPNQSRDMPLHTDNGDIVSLYVKSTSANGGRFFVAPIAKTFERMMASSPKLAQELTKDWIIINPSSERTFDVRPLVFTKHGTDKVLVNCSRARLTGTPSMPRPASLPPLSSTQLLALDTLHAVAKAHASTVSLNAGDMIFFNNLETLHGRDSFQDDVEGGRKRHLLRLTLRNESKALELPKQLQNTWSTIYDHDPSEEVFSIEERLFSAAVSH